MCIIICMCICVYIYISTQTHTCIYVYVYIIYMYIHIWMNGFQEGFFPATSETPNCSYQRPEVMLANDMWSFPTARVSVCHEGVIGRAPCHRRGTSEVPALRRARPWLPVGNTHQKKNKGFGALERNICDFFITDWHLSWQVFVVFVAEGFLPSGNLT